MRVNWPSAISTVRPQLREQRMQAVLCSDWEGIWGLWVRWSEVCGAAESSLGSLSVRYFGTHLPLTHASALGRAQSQVDGPHAAL